MVTTVYDTCRAITPLAFLLKLTAAIVAGSVKIQGVMGDFEVHGFSCGILYLLNSRIAKFNHLPASCTDKMIVLFALVRFFELGNILAELMLNNETAIK